jgi:tetratricopeptide (TPR) repeat protein
VSADEASVPRSAGRRRAAGPQPEPGVSASSLPPLKVGVRHGSLEHAPYRLLLGHFQGLPLTSAEARLNERSDGRLERLLLMNLYPQRLGEVALLEPVDEAPPRGAVIVGLGPSGELAAAELRGVVTRALLRVALNELDSRLAREDTGQLDRRPLGVSTVLIGSSAGGGLTVEASVRALIDATAAANARLKRLKVRWLDDQHEVTDLVRYDVLEMIERYEDRVDLVVGVLDRLEKLDRRERDRGRHQPITYRLEPELGEGRSSANPPMDAAGEVWRRVDIRASTNDDGATVRLEFTSIGRLARAERIIGDVERAIVDQLLDTAINDPSDDAVCGALFELLVPQALKGELGSGENLQLLVGPDEADVPWELLRPRPEDQEQQVPLALRVGLLRQFREHEELRFASRRPRGNNVLVIGNPPSEGLPALSGAADEAREVVKEFALNPDRTGADNTNAEKWEVRPLIWPVADDGDATGSNATPEPTEALYALLNGDWRIIHIAAHGDFTDQSSTTGVVLGSMRLTANVFSKLSVVPDVVFLNACHLGRVADGQQRLASANRAAASVARALVGLGVRAVVVAGWAIDDRAAETFATRLYRDLLGGQDFGQAVANARYAAWKTAKTSLTWGAYQCYGDPGFRLSPRSTGAAAVAPNTMGDLERRIQQLLARAGDQGRSAATDRAYTLKQVGQELSDLQKRAEELEAWSLFAGIAEVWAELFDFDRAIELYEEALSRGDSAVPLRALEQLGNLQIREACRRHRAGQTDSVSELADSALSWLNRALDIGESGERLALVGSYHKKKATMTSGEERRTHLDQARKYYKKANAKSNEAYHELNARQLVSIARLRNGGPHDRERTAGATNAAVRSSASNAVDSVPSDPDKAADFWSRAQQGDRLLTTLLEDVAARRSDEQIHEENEVWERKRDELVDAYAAAFRLRSSARERATVIDHLDDLAELVPEDHPVAPVLSGASSRLKEWPETRKAGGSSIAGH